MAEDAKIDLLTHVNLGTGLVSFSRRDDIDLNDAVACLTAYAQGQNEFVPVPAVAGFCFDGYTMKAQILLLPSDDDCTSGAAIVFFFGPNEEPVITLAIVRRASHGPAMWRLLIESALTPISAVDYPREPWVARRMEHGAVEHAAILPALSVVERTLAWAWLGYMDALDERQNDSTRS
jgi:hypothetical protein